MTEKYFCEFCEDECENWRGSANGREVGINGVGIGYYQSYYMLICDNDSCCECCDFNYLLEEDYEKMNKGDR